MCDTKPRQYALRKGRVSMQNWAYTITKCVYARNTTLLIQPEISDILINAFIWCREHERIRMGGFVIMPDHYHIILALRKDCTLSSIMATIDRFTARKINSYLSQLTVAPTLRKGQFWERGYYDHAHHSAKDFIKQLEYIHNNPVRKRFVDTPEEWQFSTANPKWSYLIDWDWFKP